MLCNFTIVPFLFKERLNLQVCEFIASVVFCTKANFKIGFETQCCKPAWLVAMCAKCIHSNFESAWYQAENGTCDACSLSTKILQAGIGVIKGLHLNSIATEACPLLHCCCV